MKKIKNNLEEMNAPFSASSTQFTPYIGPIKNAILRKAKMGDGDYSRFIGYFIEELIWNLYNDFGEKIAYKGIKDALDKFNIR